jgi:hypothetical protein
MSVPCPEGASGWWMTSLIYNSWLKTFKDIRWTIIIKCGKLDRSGFCRGIRREKISDFQRKSHFERYEFYEHLHHNTQTLYENYCILEKHNKQLGLKVYYIQ